MKNKITEKIMAIQKYFTSLKEGLGAGKLYAIVAVAIVAVVVAAFSLRNASQMFFPSSSLSAQEYIAPASIANQPLQVVQTTPQGELDASLVKKEIAVVFNHPMKDLGILKKMDSGVFEIDPPVKGRFRWYGSKVNAFIPETGYAPSTNYTVTVKKGIESLNGKTLQKDTQFHFSSEYFQVRFTSPYAKNISKNSKFEVAFNYPVDLQEAKKYIFLELEDGKKIAGSQLNFSYKKDSIENGKNVKEEKSRLIVIPRKPLPKNTSLSLVIQKELKPIGGNIGFAEDFKKYYQTYGPLHVHISTTDLNFYDDLYRVSLEFSNQVDIKTALSNIEVSPQASLRFDLKAMESYNTSSLSFNYWNLQPNQSYTFRLKNKFQDIDENLLADSSEKEFSIDVPQLRRNFTLKGYGIDFMETQIPHLLPVRVQGMAELNMTVSRMHPQTLLDFYSSKNSTYRFPSAQLTSQAQNKKWKTSLNRNQSRLLPYDFSWYSKNKPGWYYFVLEGGVDKTKYNYDSRNIEIQYGVNQSESYMLQVTRMAVIVKSDFKHAHFWLRNFADNKPVAEAKAIALDLNKNSFTCTTNSEGYCKVAIGKEHLQKPIFVVGNVTKDSQDIAMLTSKAQANMWSISPHFDVKAYVPELRGAIVFDRRLYRPGDKVQGKAILALKEHGEARPFTDEVMVEIFDARGNMVYQKDFVRPSKQGGVEFHFTTKKDAPVGHYRVSIRAEKNANKISLSETFQVEEYRPLSFTVNSSGLKNLQVGEPLTLELSARYLFGLPMRDAPFQLTVSRKPFNLLVEQYPQYVFGDDEYSEQWLPASFDTIAETQGQLDSTGKFIYQLPMTSLKEENLKDKDISRHYEIETEVTVQDVDDRSVSNNQKAIVFAGDTLIGTHIEDRFHSTSKPFVFSILTLDQQYKPKNSMAEVFIYKKEWKTIMSKSGSDEVQRQSTLEYKEVYSKTISVKGETTFSHKVKESGNYVAFIKVQGEQSYTRVNFYAYGSGEYISWYFSDDDTVSLLADKYEYKIGDTARILVQSPFEKATAIVTVEREDIKTSQVVSLDSNSKPIEIPILEEYAPNVYVSVVLLRPRSSLETEKNTDESDPGRPRALFGTLNLKVDVSSKYLPLTLTTKKDHYAPRDKVNVTIKTKPYAEVTLAVSDRAVLDILNYRFPDITQRVYNNWAHGVLAYSNHKYLVQQMNYSSKGDAPGGKGLELREASVGGFQKDGEDGIRKDFRANAYWAATLKADKKGKIHLDFTLPDNLTTFRMMAIAAKDGSYQTTEKEIVVKQPLVLQTSMPRFMRVGDRLKIGAVLINQSGADGNFQVELHAPLLKSLDTKEKLVRQVPLANGKSVEVVFDVEVDEAQFAKELEKLKNNTSKSSQEIIDGKLFLDVILNGTLTASSNKHKDARTFSFPIKPMPATETVTVSGFAEKESEEFFTLPQEQEIFQEHASLQLELSSTVLSNLGHGFAFYQNNPYLCLEQRASFYLLSLVYSRLQVLQGESSLQKLSLPKAERLFLDELSNFQNPNGSFKNWKDSSPYFSNTYLTAYIVKVLQDAAEIDKTRFRLLSSSVYKKSIAYLYSQIKDFQLAKKENSLEALSLILYVLQREKQGNVSLQKFLLSKAKEMSLRSQAYLYMTLSSSLGKEKLKESKQAQELSKEIFNRMDFTSERVMFSEKYYNYPGLYYSHGSAAGVILQMLVKTNPENPLIFMLVKEIIQSSQTLWTTTNATGSLALALYHYHKTFEKEMSFHYQASLSNKSLLEGKFSGFKDSSVTKDFSYRFLKENFASKRHRLSFQKNKELGRLYYNARFSYALPQYRSYPLDRGITLIREIVNVEEKENMDATDKRILSYYQGKVPELERGKMYLYRYTVATPKPVYSFMLTEFLPANVEVVNTSFASEGNSYARFVEQKRTNQDSEDYYAYSHPIHYDFYDDKVDIRSDYLSAGVHEMYFLARPLVKGEALYPPAKAFAMYEPDYFGTSSGGIQVVK